jgi:geranylgeranyl transferase type-2 subunit alpha
MFHGNKKKENTKISTEEEIKKSEQQLNKIKIIQKEILDRKEKNELDEKNLELLIKVAVIMPDFYTLWNYRKKIILDLENKKSHEDYYKFLKNEINQISYFQKTNPKSYVLWNHRIWCLQNVCKIEKILDIHLEASLLTAEINNCNFFLERDDRNFHVWNHRFTIFNLIRENFKEKFGDFLKKELNFTISMIKKNCSNFSAWHYRAKLIPLYFVMNNIKWNSEDALNYLQIDLELIINAVFTDPKDQTPWNYHLWIVNNVTSPYVK